MSTDPAPVIVEGVGYEYDSGLRRHHVLRDVSLRIEPGEIVILTGPSGSGKTTLITLIGALRAMQSGSIRIFGATMPAKLFSSPSCRTRTKFGLKSTIEGIMVAAMIV